MSGRALRIFRSSIFVFCLAVLTSFAAWGQNVGSVGGTIKDPEGKAVVGAKVTVTNLANNSPRSTQTDKDGSFGITGLEPGTYKIEIGKEGFKTHVATNVAVLVSTPTNLDVSLELGVATQTVTVEGATAPTLNTQDATVGTAFEEQQIKDLPFAARNVVNLLTLQPGVVFTGRTNTDLLAMGSNQGLDSREGVVNGIRGNQSNVTVDGVDSNDWHNQSPFTSALPVTLDSVQEFRVTTTSANSTDGLTGGAQVALVTKSGSNDFHGNVRWYGRTTGLSANSFFNNINGTPRPGLQRNQMGASLGGKLIKDRLYFFVDNEERRDSQGANVEQSVPTTSLRNGVLIYQCQTPAQCPGGTVAGLSGNVTIPAGDFGLSPANITSLDPRTATGPDGVAPGINPAMVKYMNLFPTGTDPGFGIDPGLNFIGFRFNSPVTTASNVYIGRLDYKITRDGNHSIFWRGTLQGLAHTISTAQFPGQNPASNLLNNSRGFAVNYQAVLSPTLSNLVKYGYTRQGVNQSGTQGSQFDVRSYSDILNFGARQAARIVPVHSIGDDLTWDHGKHTLQFGGNLFIVTDNLNTQSSSFPGYFVNNGFCISLCEDVPNSFGSPGPGAAFPQAFNPDAVTRSFMMLTGSMTEFSDTAFGNPSTGAILPVGAPDARSFREDYIEGYIQDTWKFRSNITATFGVRYGYETPVWEANGFEVAPTFDIYQWFQNRIVDMNNGVPSSASPLLSWNLAGKANKGANSWYVPYHKDVMPRFALAYSPDSDNGIIKSLIGGSGKSVLRVGVGWYDDKVGQAIAINSDVNGSPGTSTSLSNSSQQYNLGDAPRFTGTCSSTGCIGLPAISTLLPVPTKATFPFTPVADTSGLGFAVDPHLRTPYAIHLTASFQRELPGKVVLDLAYVGTLGRRELGKVDLAQYLNIRDPKSGMDLFTAFDKIALLANIAPPGGSSHAAINPKSIAALQTIQDIPFFNNMLPNMPAFLAANFSTPGYSTLTPTQAFYAFAVRAAAQSWSCALFPMDVGIGPSNSGPPSPWNTTVDPAGSGLVLFQPQFQGLSAWTNLASSNYHSLQVSVRRSTHNMSFTANYVYSRSIDNGSGGENVDLGSSGGAGLFGALIQNPFNLRLGRSVSDFNLKHNFNGTVAYDLPFGRGQHFGSSVGRVTDAIIGGWEIVGIVRWHSGFPFGPGNGFNFPTNFELTTPGTLIAPISTHIVPVGNVGTVSRPNLFSDAKAALADVAFTLPGFPGSRNALYGPAYFDTDLGIFKTIKMPWKENQTLRLQMTAFNVFNDTNFNGFNISPTSPTNFGNFTSTAAGSSITGGAREVELAARFSF
jgi:hypothetical protein